VSLLDFIIWLPALAAIAILFGSPARITALGAAAINVLLVGFAWYLVAKQGVGSEGFSLEAKRPISDALGWGYNVGADGLSIILLVLSALVTLAALWDIEKSDRATALSVLLISTGAMGAFCSTDLFFFFAFHELALIPTFLMIALRGQGDRQAAAWKTTIYLAGGSLVLLIGLVMLVQQAGAGHMTFDMIQLKAQAATLDAHSQANIFLWLLLGFGVLISLFPFHGWAIPAYSCAPTPVAMMHAGVLKKFGIYGLLRVGVGMLPEALQAPWLLNLLLVLLLGNILWMGYVTVAQKHLDTMIASSSVMHMGYAFLGIAAGSLFSLQGVAIMMLAHGLSVAVMLGMAAKIRVITGSLEFSRLGGLGGKLKNITFLFALGLFASAGLPGFGNFVGEFLIFSGSFASMETTNGFSAVQWTTIVAVWGIVLTAVYALRGFQNVFLGSRETECHGSDIGGMNLIPWVLLLAVLLLSGIFPGVFLDLTRGIFQTSITVPTP
jgi:NADH-quinone oxidoreductase subunit M